ncbi:hypothetical protein N7509_006644 [Penicillium cosmopolitanum]|uniref:Uncharacterized protein n=1 Tax=Penicillium cosmopolitanum TaxID=1131564 RepID=A0A9W9VXJ5_9EURO|nr:uncharacterized protein N7509_006644 [Penicillium cosmopolitanum]KAJ5391154.1 hypothetical protein N7509_006644 [Penicillium cosmopolitanum]
MGQPRGRHGQYGPQRQYLAVTGHAVSDCTGGGHTGNNRISGPFIAAGRANKEGGDCGGWARSNWGFVDSLDSLESFSLLGIPDPVYRFGQYQRYTVLGYNTKNDQTEYTIGRLAQWQGA